MIKKAFKGFVDYMRRTDIILWFLLMSIAVYSLVLLKSVSRATSENYFRTQLLAIALGLLGAVVLSLIDYSDIAGFWYLIAGFSIFLMLYTAAFGEEVSGSGGVSARAWIRIAGRTFQPSELVKITFIITFAKHLDVIQKKGILNEPAQVILLGCHALVPVVLCELQGDTGAAVVFFFIFAVMSFSAGVKLRYFAILGVLLIAAVPLLWRFVMKPYQKRRFIAVFNLDDESIRMDDGFQQYEGRISIGSGRLKGRGLFEGSRVANNSVPFQHSDYIFSVAGEELGLIGCSLVIILLLLFMLRILGVARSSRDELGKYICFGYFGMIALQTISNIGMCLALLPAMGVTLPFFSAGGSSTACLYWGFGIIQSVYMHRGEIDGIRLRRSRPLRFTYSQMKKL